MKLDVPFRRLDRENLCFSAEVNDSFDASTVVRAAQSALGVYMVRLMAVLGVIFLSACSSSGSGSGVGGGAGGGASGGGAGGGSTVAFTQLCADMSQGFRASTIAAVRECSPTATVDEDVAHRALIEFGSPLPSTSTNQLFWDQTFGCSPALDGGSTLLGFLQLLADSVDAGRISYNPANAARCKSGSSRDGGLAPECSEIFKPLVPVGGSCVRVEECSNDAYCKAASLGSCGGQCVLRLADGVACEQTRDRCLNGACVAASGGYRCVGTGGTDAGVGEPCAFSSNTTGCQPRLRCVRDPASPTLPDGGTRASCALPVNDGQACGVVGGVASQPAPCASNCSVCFATDGGPGVCQAKRSAGGACVLEQDCQPFHQCLNHVCTLQPRPGEPCLMQAIGGRGSCRWADNYCKAASADAGTGICTSLPILGQACGARADLTRVCGQGFCELDGGVGQCRAEPTLGQSCSTTCASGLRCLRPAGTDGGASCQNFPSVGEACTGACASGAQCVSSVCVARLTAGATCTSDDGCASDNCLLAQRVCAAPCAESVKGVTATGCPNGLRDLGLLLGGVGVAFARRRRQRPPS